MKDKIFMVVFILVLGSFWTTALVVVDSYTKPRIEKYAAEKLRKSILGAFDIPYEGKDIGTIFKGNIEVIEKQGKTVYRTKNEGAVAFKIAGSGSQGPLSGVLALQADLRTIKGITIVSQVETPGLGDRVLEKANLDKFKGKKMVPALRILATGGAAQENEVDGISGATLTCKAFERILNTQSKEYSALLKQE